MSTNCVRRVVTQNYGLNRHRDATSWRSLDATRHVAAQRPGEDGYVDANVYSRLLPRTIHYRQPGGVRGM